MATKKRLFVSKPIHFQLGFLRMALVSFSLVIILSSCNFGDHFITDKSYREKVEKQFQQRKSEAANRSDALFGVFNGDLSKKEEEALKFLYAYMPLSDLADYDGEYFLKNVRASFAARDTFSWGRVVPEDLFRHFVLPVRVNNENLDSSRWVFFMELKDRIKGMPMKQATLEVNHWCHEKVNYQGTDGRTSSPLATVKSAFGRCGEESTFTVAALRSVGIPARQCYTPRWAHGDDNHAWVEVWVDSTWHFIGACEPEADLDMAWFTAPAKRAMLVNTNVFGDYEGIEDVLLKDPLFTRINILSNYAPVKRLYAKIKTTDDALVDSAVVEFQLYNYAEFYPLHRAVTGKDGVVSFQTGLGDLVVWAAKDGKFGYRKVTVNEQDTVELVLNHLPGETFTDQFELTPPLEAVIEVTVSDSAKVTNAKRLAFEDKVREGYIATFIDSLKSARLAATLKIDSDSLWMYLRKSRGNWRTLVDFITEVPSEKRNVMFPLLSSISEKDLRDISTEVLIDNMQHTEAAGIGKYSWENFTPYLLSPRVDNEWLRPYKSYFQHVFQQSFIDSARRDPSQIVYWIKANIRLDRVSNYGRAPLTPIGSYELKITDAHSRDILFVAICRSFGIAARLEPGTRTPQYLLDGKWMDVHFEKPDGVQNLRSALVLVSDGGNARVPEYYIHFTLEKYEHGFFRSLDYETDPRLKTFPCELSLAPGYYLLATGNRITLNQISGCVLVNLNFFNLNPSEENRQNILIRKEVENQAPLGKVDVKKLFAEMQLKSEVPQQIENGLIVAWMESGKEPTKHFVADLKSKANALNGWNGKILLLFRSSAEVNAFKAMNGKTLPKNTWYAHAANFSMDYLGRALGRSLGKELPVVVYVRPNGEVTYLSQGYRIGIGDELMRVLRK